MDSMQLPLVGGLVALLVLLLVARSVGRRRAARPTDAEAPVGPSGAEAVGRVDAVGADHVADGSAAPEAELDDAEVASEPQHVGLDLLEPVTFAEEQLDVRDELDAPVAEDGVGLPDPEPAAVPARRRWFGRRRRGASEDTPAATADETVDPEAGPMLDGWPEPADALRDEAGVAELPQEPVDQPVEEPVDEPVEETVDGPVEETVEETARPVARRRRGFLGLFRRRAEPTDLLVEPEGDADDADDAGVPAAAQESEAVGDDPETPETPETAETPAAAETPEQELKALREQLRALELVVQQQSADHPTAALAKVEETVAEQSAAYLRQVSLVVSGLAAHTSEDENPRRTLARVAAAVERLGVPNSMERPILPVSHELSSRSHGDGSRHPSHLLEPQEQGTGGRPAEPARSQVADVFAGLDAAVAPVHPTAPEGAGVAEPRLAPLIQPAAQQPTQAPAPAVPQGYLEASAPEEADATAAMPAFGQPTGNVHDLSALAAYDADYPGGYDAASDAGIPAFEEPPAVLPVPPPAAPEQSRRRRGRKSKS